MTTCVLTLVGIPNVTDDVRSNNVINIENMSVMKVIKSSFGHTLNLIRHLLLIPYETTCVRSRIYNYDGTTT